MNIEENSKKIKILTNKYSNINLRKLKKDFYEYLEYLKDNCELNLRNILDKYYNNEELSEVEQEMVEKYIFYSNPNLFSGLADGPSLFDLSLQSEFGSGNFNQQEIEILKNINNENKEKSRRRKI